MRVTRGEGGHVVKEDMWRRGMRGEGEKRGEGVMRWRQRGEGDAWQWGDTACGATRVMRGEGGTRGEGATRQGRRNRATRRRQLGEGDTWRWGNMAKATE